MVTKKSLQHRLIAAENLELDREWFDRRPARSHRMRLPTFDELRDYGRKCTHVIVVRQGVKRLTRVPVTLPGGYPLYLNTMMKCADAPKDGVLDLNITGVMKAHRAGRRINLEEIFFWASSSFR